MLKGIDISHFSSITPSSLQDMVVKNNLYFTFIKASEGATLQDNKFIQYWQMSREAGLICGAYHFFRPLSDAVVQAAYFVSIYKQVSRTGVLPPVIDLEWSTVGPSSNPSEQWKQLLPNKRIPAIKTYLSSIETALNVKPVIYTAVAFWQEFIQSQSTPADTAFFAQYSLWIVDLKNNGSLPAPWTGGSAPFVQTHFGETATTQDLFDVTDQNEFRGDLKTFLNSTVPGFTIMKGFPFSNLVVEIQRKLVEKQFLNDVPDGLFGSNTEKAIMDFQSSKGLFANGIVDAQTWNQLL